MSTNTFFTLILACFFSNLIGQTQTGFEVLFEKKDTSLPGLKIKDAIQADNGLIYAVGFYQKLGSYVGVMLSVDLTGKVKIVDNYDLGPGIHEVNGLIQLHSGLFLLVGSTQNNNSPKSGWVLKIDQEGTIVDDKTYLAKSMANRQITHVAQNEDEQVIICGKDDDGLVTKYWLAELKEVNPLPDEPAVKYLDSGLDEIVFFTALKNGNFFVCGNYSTRAQRKLKEGGNSQVARYEIYDRSLKKIAGESLGSPKSDDKLITGSFNVADGSITLIAQSLEGDNAGNIRVFGFDQTGRLQENNNENSWTNDIINYGDGDEALGGLSALGNQLLIAARVKFQTPNLSLNKLALHPRAYHKMINGTIQVARFILTSNNQWIGIGTLEERSKNSFYIIGLRPNVKSEPEEQASQDYRAKSIEPLSGGLICHTAHYNDKADSILSSNDQGSLSFKIENRTSTDLHSLQLEVISSNQVGGLIFNSPYKKVLPIIGKGQVVPGSVAIRAESIISPGTSNFFFRVLKNDKELCRTYGKVVSVQKSRPRAALTVIKKEPTQDNKHLSVIIREIKPDPLRPVKAEIRHNGIVMTDLKSFFIDEKQVKKSDDELIHKDYAFKVELATGENVTIFNLLENDSLIGKETVIYYQPRTLNLHFLGIAPINESHPLKYNVNDVQDIAAALKNANDRYKTYDYIHTQVLKTKDSTSRGAIDIAFEDIKNRANPDYDGPRKIHTNDVIFIFISSHGIIVDDKFRIVTSNYDSDSKIATTVDLKYNINTYLKTNNNNHKIIIFIDACHSGGAKSIGLSENLIQTLSDSRGMLILTSSSKEEFSYESDALQNGAFTEALLEALNPAKLGAVNKIKDDSITYGELIDYVKLRVPQLAASTKDTKKESTNGSQNSSTIKQTPNTPVDDINLSLPFFIIQKN